MGKYLMRKHKDSSEWRFFPCRESTYKSFLENTISDNVFEFRPLTDAERVYLIPKYKSIVWLIRGKIWILQKNRLLTIILAIIGFTITIVSTLYRNK